MPKAVKFRDVVEYLDNYLGQWGDRKHLDVTDVTVYLERSDRNVWLHLAEGLTLDVQTTKDAAATLAADTLAILEGA